MAPISSKTPDSVSRYGNVKANELEAHKEVKPEDIPGIVDGLRKTFASEVTYSVAWRKAQIKQLKKMLVEREEEIAAAVTEDIGKSAFESYATEIGLVIAECDTALSHIDEWVKPVATGNSALNIPSWSQLRYDPLGVVLVMAAWNYPVQLALAPMVAALAGGNCVCLKPASWANATSNVLAKLLPQYMDNSAVQVVEGNRHITSALLEEAWSKIIFTGSGFVGRIVAQAAAKHLTPVVLELGGKSPCIVDKSVDVEHAAQRLVWGSFVNSGQTCVRPDHCLVHEDVADDFIKELQRQVLKMYGEDPQKTEWFSRLVNANAFDRLKSLVDEEQDRVVIGGKYDASDKYIAPTILDFGADMEAFTSSGVMQDELFGPILPVVRYRNLEDVIDFVKNLITGKPLALYAYSKDNKFIETIKTRTTSGGLVINDNLMHLANHELPFGGVGASGTGSYHGHHGFKCMSHEKACLQKSQILDQSPAFKPLLQARFPPYTPTKQALVRMFSNHHINMLVNLPMPLLRVGLKAVLLYLCLRLAGFNIVRQA
ncbi:Aldehyde dehydrogenase (Cp-ALDH) [Durusdinium trenchii]|uniref:Aldehyde dehydrogenase n=1 Tax=Durusdinium trenchii TaxID=1381693 RepID=A0ABP0MLZ4_9DINO